MENYILIKNDELYHYGILGQKCGVRRYQNADGSLTEDGRKHANVQKYKMNRTDYEKYMETQLKGKNKTEKTKVVRREARDLAEGGATYLRNLMLKAAAVGAGAGAAAATIGSEFVNNEKDRAKGNLMNQYYDDLNIDENTKRRLNL